MKINNINKYLNKTFMFDSYNSSPSDLFKGFVIITILILIYIKLINI